jgi:ribose-phosphate pyrophosphokinase
MKVILGSVLSIGLRDAFNDASAAGTFELLNASLSTFPSSESFAEIIVESAGPNGDALQGQNITILQSMTAPIDVSAMQLIFAVKNAHDLGAQNIIVAAPFMPYNRQDRGFDDRLCSIGSKYYAEMLKNAGATHVISSEMHSKASEQFYLDVFGTDNVVLLQYSDLIAQDVKNNQTNDPVIGAPDGADKPTDAGQRRANELRSALGLTKKFKIWKTHQDGDVNATEIKKFSGNVKGQDCVIIDDLTDSGGTLVNAATTLKQKGAKSVTCYLSHGVLVGDAAERLLSLSTALNGVAAIDRLAIIDSIPSVADKRDDLIKACANDAALAAKCPDVAARFAIIDSGQHYVDAVKKLNLKL